MLFKKSKDNKKEAAPAKLTQNVAPVESPKSVAPTGVVKGAELKPAIRLRRYNFICADKDKIPAGDFLILQVFQVQCYTHCGPKELLILDLNANRLDGHLYRVEVESVQVSCDNEVIYDWRNKRYVGCVVRKGNDGLFIDEVSSIFDRERKVSKLIQKFVQNDASYKEMRDLRTIYNNIYRNIAEAMCDSVEEIFGEKAEETKDIEKKIIELMPLPLNTYIDKCEALNEEAQIKINIQKRHIEEEKRKAEIKKQEEQKQEIKEIKEYMQF